ncbi:putative UDP-N-acetylglucosamine--peptide N-acetylglucosaminyltransferase SPINDLY [Hordeum vulgare]|nr:putative UDP-N-acetylglucosamine--peptide N-acetylglucosaminyltransferase SPINDLY [Hordeum vulgare]
MLEEKKALIQEKKVKIIVDAEDAKMLSLNLKSLDADTRIVVQTIRYKMLQRQKDELEAPDKEKEQATGEEEEASYAADDTLGAEARIAGPTG